MSWIRAIGIRVATPTRRVIGASDAAADLDARAELEAHLELETERYIGRGMSDSEARRAALVASGGLTVATEHMRERRGLPGIESVMSDLRYAVRSLVAQPGYSLAVVLTLGLGIGANSAMFAIVNAVVLRALPYPEPDLLVAPTLSFKGRDTEVVDDRVFFAWVESARSASFAAYSRDEGVATLATGPEELHGMQVTAPYFGIMRVRPLIGRTFTADEDKPGVPRVIVLAERLWRREFGADAAINGRSIQIDGRSHTVIGVLPASFATPGHPEFWLPYRLTPPVDSSTFYYMVVGRMRPGTSLETLRSELATIAGRVDAARPAKDRGLTPVVMTLHDRLYGERRTPLLLLFGAVGVLLLIACANLANLALARSRSRQREFAVRAALGAGRGRLVRYLLSESLVLAVAGAALGLVLAGATLAYFTRLSPAAVGNVEDIRLDGTVLLFTLVTALVTAALFGLIPALVAGRADLHRLLSAGGPRAGEKRHQQFVRRALVVGQLSTALVLLTAAGLVARTFARVASIDPGFRADGLVAATFRLPEPRYSDESVEPFFSAVLSRVRRVPGVDAAALVDVPPLAGVRMSVFKTDSGREGPRIDIVAVGDDYFRTVGARIVEGRPIDASDRAGAPGVAVVNAALARQFFPGKSAIGQPLPVRERVKVVGVATDVLQRDLEITAKPLAYVPMAQEGATTHFRVMARTSVSVEAFELALRQIVRSVDPVLPPPELRRMDEALAEQMAPRKFTFLLLALFASLAALLAVVGLYGVLAHVVADRTREIGIRAALGADRARVVRMIVKQGAALVAAGMACGLIAAGAMTRLVESLLYGVSPNDPSTFVGVTLGLVVVAMLATVVPAWRAAQVDPIIALRSE
jgi:predicted permease